MSIFKVILLIILVGMLSSGSTYLFCLLQRKKSQQRQLQALQMQVAEQREGRLQTATVLEVLEYGLIAYGADGNLVSANKAAHRLLGDVPEQFNDFMDKYGDNGHIRSSLLLGSRLAETKFECDGKDYFLRVREQNLQGQRKPGHVILVQDISASEQEERQRRQFVANVSHELKTPLTIIKSYAESLVEWGVAEKERDIIRRDVKQIYDDSVRMESLIDDLLLLSRIDAQALGARTERMDLGVLVKSVVQRMQTQAEDKGQSLICHLVNQCLQVYIDRQSMERVLMNLISNAIKYTPENGEIHVYAGSLIDDVYIKVRDNGIGIPETELERIFDRFYRVDNTGSRLYGGTGLGLSIVKELVNLHGGEISVRSREQQMSEFTIILPSHKKSLRDLLLSTAGGQEVSSIIRPVVAADLESIAQGLNIVAKWDSLQGAEQATLLEAIEQA